MATTLPLTNTTIPDAHEAAYADTWAPPIITALTNYDTLSGLNSRQVTSNTTLALTDHGKTVFVNSSSALVITLPQNSTVDLPDGFQCSIVRKGSGTVTLAKEGSDTLSTVSSYTAIANRYGAVTVAKYGDGDWWAWGDLG